MSASNLLDVIQIAFNEYLGHEIRLLVDIDKSGTGQRYASKAKESFPSLVVEKPLQGFEDFSEQLIHTGMNWGARHAFN